MSKIVDNSNTRDFSHLDKDDRELLEYVLDNMDKTDEEMASDPMFADAERIKKLLTAVDPYLRSVPGTSGKVFSFSITNMREEYIKKFTLTAISGYLYRMMDESRVSNDVEIIPEDQITPEIMKKYEFIPWEWHDKKTFDETIIKPLKEAIYQPDPALSDEENGKRHAIYNHEMAEKIIALIKERNVKIFMHQHCIIKKFLDKSFRYNPDRHVRSAYAEPTYMAEQDELMGTGLRPSLKKKLNKYRNKLLEGGNHFTDVIPPRDVFLRLHRYIESNYEKIQEAVHMLYHETPDLDVVLNVHELHADLDEAKAYREKYRDNLMTDIMVGETGQWICLAPYKTNRSKRSFFNKDTRHLEEIIRQKESDLKIGRDMLKKRVQRTKYKNNKEEGEDSELVKSYQSSMNTLKNPDGCNSTKISKYVDGTKTEYIAGKSKYDPTANSADIDDNLPDDAIQMNMYHIKDDGKVMVKEPLFIEAHNEDDGPMQATIYKA